MRDPSAVLPPPGAIGNYVVPPPATVALWFSLPPAE